jgi:MFS family permease
VTARRHAWLLVAVLWVLALLNYLDRQVIFSVFPLLSADLGLSNVQLGLLSTVFLWVYGVLSPISGFVADRFGRGRSISFSLLVWSAVTLLTGFSTTFTQLISARALMGISEACYLPAALAKIAAAHGPRTRSLAVGLHQSGLYVGMILGGVGGGWIGERYGWRAPFLILGAVGILYFAFVYLFFRNSNEKADHKSHQNADRNSHKNADRKSTENADLQSRDSMERSSDVATPNFSTALRELHRTPGFATMTIVFSAVAIANWLVYTWLPVYLYERFGMSLASAGFTATFYIQAASFGGIILGGWLADRWSGKSERGRIYTQTFGVMLASPFLFVLGYTSSHAILLLALILFGVGRGFYDCNTMPVLCQVARDDLRSTGYGIFNFAGCLAGGIAAVMAGALKNSLGLSAAFQIAGAILCLSGLLLLRIRVAPARE